MAASPGGSQINVGSEGMTKGDPKTFAELVKKLENGSKRLLHNFQFNLGNKAKNAATERRDEDIRSFKENPSKNRFESVVCLEQNRVILRDGLPGNYIHASYINGFGKEKRYIATQAPKLESVVDFWRMVWQENPKIIVCLTNLKDLDAGNTTCFWPQRPTEIHRFGPVMVRNLGFREQDSWVETALEIAYYGGNCSRVITHLMYAEWDDKRAPSSCTSLRRFRTKMLNTMEKPLNIAKARVSKKSGPSKTAEDGPIIVLCSTGAGRAGTFVTLDICLTEMEKTGQYDTVDRNLEEVRRQRPGSVETENQYVCLFLSVVCAAMEKHPSLTLNHFAPFQEDYATLPEKLP